MPCWLIRAANGPRCPRITVGVGSHMTSPQGPTLLIPHLPSFSYSPPELQIFSIFINSPLKLQILSVLYTNLI